MSRHDLQEPLQSLPPLIDDVLGEPVGEDFAWEGRDVDLGGKERGQRVVLESCRRPNELDIARTG